MTEFKRAGLGATMWAVLILFGVLVIVGLIAWIRRTPHNVPTSPATPTSSMYRLEPRRSAAFIPASSTGPSGPAAFA